MNKDNIVSNLNDKIIKFLKQCLICINEEDNIINIIKESNKLKIILKKREIYYLNFKDINNLIFYNDRIYILKKELGNPCSNKKYIIKEKIDNDLFITTCDDKYFVLKLNKYVVCGNTLICKEYFNNQENNMFFEYKFLMETYSDDNLFIKKLINYSNKYIKKKSKLFIL